MFNLDKCGYASDLASIETTAAAIQTADPDLVLHLEAESHVDRSIEGPGAYGSASSPDCVYIASNVSGTFILLQAVRAHPLGATRHRAAGRFPLPPHLHRRGVRLPGRNGAFLRNHPLRPRSPYSASKAASDDLVSARHHTHGLPVVLSNCSNTYGPWQISEKLILVVILKAAAGSRSPCVAMA